MVILANPVKLVGEIKNPLALLFSQLLHLLNSK
jgi:hypothetical protein